MKTKQKWPVWKRIKGTDTASHCWIAGRGYSLFFNEATQKYFSGFGKQAIDMDEASVHVIEETRKRKRELIRLHAEIEQIANFMKWKLH